MCTNSKRSSSPHSLKYFSRITSVNDPPARRSLPYFLSNEISSLVHLNRFLGLMSVNSFFGLGSSSLIYRRKFILDGKYLIFYSKCLYFTSTCLQPLTLVYLITLFKDEKNPECSEQLRCFQKCRNHVFETFCHFLGLKAKQESQSKQNDFPKL